MSFICVGLSKRFSYTCTFKQSGVLLHIYYQQSKLNCLQKLPDLLLLLTLHILIFIHSGFCFIKFASHRVMVNIRVKKQWLVL